MELKPLNNFAKANLDEMPKMIANNVAAIAAINVSANGKTIEKILFEKWYWDFSKATRTGTTIIAMLMAAIEKETLLWVAETNFLFELLILENNLNERRTREPKTKNSKSVIANTINPVLKIDWFA